MYADALRSDPSDLVLRTKLAEVLRLLGRDTEAISIYRSVAWAHGVSGNLGQAIMICKLILELNPTHSATQEMLAKLYASKQVREQKQAVPVVKVGGRWVADPRCSGAPAALPSAVTSAEAGSPAEEGPAAGSVESSARPDGEEVTSCERPGTAARRREVLPSPAAARRPSFSARLPELDELPEYARERTRVGDDVPLEADPCWRDEVAPAAPFEPPPLPRVDSEERPLPGIDSEESPRPELPVTGAAAGFPAGADLARRG